MAKKKAPTEEPQPPDEVEQLGTFSYNCETSTHCGRGRICFDYELPRPSRPAGLAGTSVQIALQLYQDGKPIKTLSSGQLTSGTSYCFEIDPAKITGLAKTKGGFDFSATAKFAFGKLVVGMPTVGAAPDGINPGVNNDYRIECQTTESIIDEQDDYLTELAARKRNHLAQISCHCGTGNVIAEGVCSCDCQELDLPPIEPCLSVAWGESACDCFETDDTEVVTITAVNCYSNVVFAEFTIGRIVVTDLDGNPVPELPNGEPSVRLAPSGPICFGDIGPCTPRGNQPGTVTRDVILETRGAVPGGYKLSLEGVSFNVCHTIETERCFLLNLCQD